MYPVHARAWEQGIDLKRVRHECRGRLMSPCRSGGERLFTPQVHYRGRAGCLKAFTNAMGSYHMSIPVQFTGNGSENFPCTVVYR
jgi:hypothetical protein